VGLRGSALNTEDVEAFSLRSDAGGVADMGWDTSRARKGGLFMELHFDSLAESLSLTNSQVLYECCGSYSELQS
jgi:hypothetical protein